ncbi:PKD domain-containing protein [Sorangium sp. So ce362]|uniref:c-type cytochrome n=1 Tax=Sorangium sp. So ce362 TaxID=3133303 RepID=UPI003F60CCDD
MRSLPKLLGLLAGICGVGAWTAEARAVTATVAERAPSLRGEAATFDLTIGDAVGPVQVRWDMGDETRTEFTVGDVQQVHTYAAPGHYPVLATVKDDVGFTSVAFVHTVHRPLVTGSAAVSTDLVYDQPNARIYTANYENDSVSVLDTNALTQLAEVPVARGPVGLALTAQGKLWVLHRDARSLSIIDTASLAVESEVMLPYASQPMGLAISPTGDAAYVSLMAVGKLLKLDVASGAVVAELVLGGTPRGVSVSHDGSQIYVTRFISEDSHGEVARIDAATFQVSTRFELAADTTTEDTDQQGRGLPNYLFSVGLSPDGLFAWVLGKKDNIFRGPSRDQLALTDDNTVRPLVALLNLAEGVEDVARRIDLDDRNLPNQVVFTPLGDYAFASVAGSALVEVRDAYTGEFVTALKETGFAPRGLALTETDKLFVHASLSRTVAVYDVADVVSSHDLITKKLADIPTVAAERLDAQVLRGKQLFFNSADVRMSDQGYISCASCHFDGADDGRVWDFGSVGEGLRNTVSLVGRRGTGHGNVNWSGSFDEIQDADDNIRDLFGGKGFLSAEQLAVGTVATPRGDKKAGLSPELDALAAFLGSLDTYRPSPFRNADGSLTEDGVAGRAIFERLGCGFCHTGPDGTDSARGKLHDVGTVKASSGMRAGEPLFGIDTPTLNGVWETAPYLHDGSAPTLRDVLVTANPEDRHAFTSALSEAELGQLIAYVQQLDGAVDSDPSEGDGAGEEPSERVGCSVTGGPGDRHAPLLAFALVAGSMTFGARRRRPA